MPEAGTLAEQRAYQAVLSEEYNRHYPEGPDGETVGLDEPETLLTESEATDIIEAEGGSFDELLDAGWLIAYDDLDPVQYRSTHFDLIYRLNNVRTERPNDPSVLENYLSLERELVPDFQRKQLRSTLVTEETILSDATIQHLLDGFGSAGDLYEVPNISTISSHQNLVMKDLLNPEIDDVALSAPTAAGKTITFLIPAIGAALEALDEQPGRIASVLTYPRKSLARDQFKGALARIERINERLPEDKQLTIGIEDGDTKETYQDPSTRDENQYQQGDTFRGFECVRDECEGPLKVTGTSDPIVVCGECDHHYPSILPTKERMYESGAEPNILLTNPYILYNRLLSPGQVDRFETVEYYAFDEAHVYTSYQGGHIQYIISLLRELAEADGSRPTFVFASATMSNPKGFIGALAALDDPDELAYQDYHETLESAGVNEERLLLRLYVLPPPRKSIQGLNQLLTEAVSLWSHRNKFKTINFIDSVAEVNTQYSYITDTIMSPDEQGGAEVVRHLLDDDISGPHDSYDWETISPDMGHSDPDAYSRYVTGPLRESIGRHFADLGEEDRTRIEDEFAAGHLRFLFSTQTLELGIDLDDVAVVMQYKLPPGGNEGVIQRIGRAGRSRQTQRVGLGVVALSSKPSSMLYMYDADVRKKLESTEHLPPAKIGTSAAVQKQQLLTRAIMNLARDGRRTYFREHSLNDTNELLEILGALRSQLNGFDYTNTGSVASLMDRDSFEQHHTELLDHLNRIIDGSDADDIDSDVEPNMLFSTIDRLYTEISKAQEGVRSILNRLRSIESLPRDPVVSLIDETQPLRDLEEALAELKGAVQGSWRSKDSRRIVDWLDKHGDSFESAADNLPTPTNLRNAVYFDLLGWANEQYEDVQAFEEAHGFDIDSLTERLTETVDELDGASRQAYRRQLLSVLEDVQALGQEDLRALSSRFAIQNFNDMDNDGFTSLYDALNVMLENSIRFTPLLQPPEPEFNLEVRT